MLRDRCNNPNSSAWKWYGGRGISYDPRWDNFLNFIEDVGWPFGLLRPTIDRIDSDGDYTKNNCRWIERGLQTLNRIGKHTKRLPKGVVLCNSRKTPKYRARIRHNGVLIHLGYFTDHNLAAKAYNKAAKKLFGEHAFLNLE